MTPIVAFEKNKREQETFLSHRGEPEVNISHARTLVKLIVSTSEEIFSNVDVVV